MSWVKNISFLYRHYYGTIRNTSLHFMCVLIFVFQKFLFYPVTLLPASSADSVCFTIFFSSLELSLPLSIIFSTNAYIHPYRLRHSTCKYFGIQFSFFIKHVGYIMCAVSSIIFFWFAQYYLCGRQYYRFHFSSGWFMFLLEIYMQIELQNDKYTLYVWKEKKKKTKKHIRYIYERLAKV